MKTTTASSQFTPSDGVNGPCLFAVNAGMPAGLALENATFMLDAIHHLADRGVMHNMDSRDSYVVKFLSQAAMGLLESVEI